MTARGPVRFRGGRRSPLGAVSEGPRRRLADGGQEQGLALEPVGLRALALVPVASACLEASVLANEGSVGVREEVVQEVP